MSITRTKKKASALSKRRPMKKEFESLQPKASSRSRIRSVGNSKGVILSNELLKAAGLDTELDIMIRATEGVIYILQLKTPEVNTDLSTWDKQFKAAIRKGARPEGDLFEGMANDFDTKEW